MDAKETAKIIRQELKDQGIKARVYVIRYKQSKDMVGVQYKSIYSYEERAKMRKKHDFHARFTDNETVVY